MSGQRGISLVEVLVAVLVLSIGMLGLAGLHSIGMKSNHGAYLRTQATVLSYDILERMRGNRELALGKGYDIAMNAQAAGDDGIAGQDLGAWKADLAALLPSGAGSIGCVPATSECTITVQWDDSRGLKAKADAGIRTFAVTTRL